MAVVVFQKEDAMRRYHAFTPAQTPVQIQGIQVVTDAQVCNSGITMLIDTAIGALLSTGHSGLEAWHELVVLGLPVQELRAGFERLEIRA
jgi:hypothetical protein